MPAKQLRQSDAARQALLDGASQVADAVRHTLGPRGRAAVLDRRFGSPQVTSDGATIVRDIELPDAFENMGAQLMAEVARRTNDSAGDGTTTATLLAHALVAAGVRGLTTGASGIGVRRGIEMAVAAVGADLTSQSRPVGGHDDVAHVATIAAGDGEIGAMIADALDEVGHDGVITVEESSSLDTEVKVVKGMQFDRGYLSAHLVTDQEKMEAVLEDVLLLLTDRKISAVADIVPTLELAVAAGRPVLIVAEDVEGEALATLVVNKLRGTVAVCAVKAPGFGDRRSALLGDLATVTGGEVVSENLGLTLERVRLEQLGRARRVVVTKDDTTIVDGAGSRQHIEARAEDLRREAKETDSDWDREKLQERVAHLVGGVAIIRVGAPTETALKERKERVEDALDATRAAVDSGLVPGGGRALLLARRALETLDGDDDERLGVKIVRAALEIPTRQLAENAGLAGGVVVSLVAAMGPTEGYDVAGERYGDLFEFGIVDPTKVVRTALESAASVAALLLTTEALVSDVPEPAGDAGGGHGHGGDMGGGMGDMGGMGGMGGMDDMDF